MTGTKRQHYVPQFYLRNFGGNLYCYDKTDSRVFSSTPQNICTEKFFYCKPSEEGKDLETALAGLEAKFATSCRELIEHKNFFHLSEESQRFLILFVAVQFLRTREKREQIGQMANTLVDFVAKSAGVTGQVELTEESIKALHNKILIKSSGEIAGIMASNLKPMVLVNKTKMPFWTSDNPLALNNLVDAYPYGNQGLTSKGIELHLPLSSKVSLTLIDREHFGIIPERGIGPLTDMRYIMHENSLQVNSSTQFLFATDKNFTFADRVLRDNPELRDTERKRITADLPALEQTPMPAHKQPPK